MSSLGWLHPDWPIPLAVSWALVAGALGLARLRASRRRRALLGLVASEPPGERASDLRLLAALAALALALAGPQWGTRVERVPASGVDLVVLLDVSRSMDARDVPPSRMDRARQLAARVLADLEPGDRAALAAFASDGVLLTPLTPDRGSLLEMLPALDSELMSQRGSRLQAGLDAAFGAFREGSPRPRALLVLSDGEEPGQPTPVDRRALAEADLRVVTVALGTDAGAPIPHGGGTLRSRRGEAVISRRDAGRLARLAAWTDGAAFAADRWGEVDAAAVRDAVRRETARVPGGFGERRLRATHVAPFTALALLLLLSDALTRRRMPGEAEWPVETRRGGGRVRRAAILATLALAALAAGPGDPPVDPPDLEAAVRRRPESAELLLRLGVNRAAEGHTREAERAFFAAAVRARDPRQGATAYYDLGVLALGEGRYEAARAAFFDALALDPDDRQARFNLEWTLRALAETPTPGGSTSSPQPAEPEDAPETPEEAAARETPPRPEPAPALAPEELARWLEAVDDDAGRALRDAARAAGSEGARPKGPFW